MMNARASGGPRQFLALALLLAAAQGLLLARTAWDKSDTMDEPYYLATAADQWARWDFSACDAPALPKWGFGAALRLSDPGLFDLGRQSGRDPLWSRPMAQGRRNLFAARMATILVTVGAGLLLWAAARRFGPLAGALAHALWCFSPAVLANGSLATLDAWAAAGAALCLFAGLRLLDRPTPARAAGLGAALALAAACKATALGLVPVAVGITAWAVTREAGPRRARLLRAGLALGAAFLFVLWAAYLFRFESIETSHLCGKLTDMESRTYGPFPLASWLGGILLQLLHGSKGHLSYLFGETGGTGWWWFYLASLALKTTLGAQLLAAGLLLERTRASRREWLGDAALLAFPALLLIVLSLGRAQNGLRYLLPAFPFAMLWAGRVGGWALERRGRLGVLLLGATLLAGTIESLAVHPHHLMFFNLWAGGPQGGPRYLVNGDDWGQDQRRLAEWQKATRPWKLYYTPYNGDARYWGVSFQAAACEPRPGYYALHAVEVHRPKRLPRGCLDWLTVEPPDQRLGYSIYLYLVTRDRMARLAEERGRVTPFWRSGAAGNEAP
jgi:hypothetical protein